MFNRQSIHIALLMWGCIFCLIAALCMYLSRDVDRSKKKLIEDNLITCIIVSHFAQELSKRYVKNDKLKFCAEIDKE